MTRFIKLALLLPLIAACGTAGGGTSPDESTALGTVTGTVTYRERIALTPEAVVEVQLLDVSIADVSARLIAEQTIKPKHQVPILFELTYDPADIDERFTYSVRATIRERGRLMFTTDRNYRVLTRANPNHVDLVLVRTSD